MATKVELAKEKLRELVDRQNALVADPFLGRNDMYKQLKVIRNEITELVQVIAPY